MALSKILVLQPCQGCQLAPAAADLPSIQLQAAQLRQLANMAQAAAQASMRKLEVRERIPACQGGRRDVEGSVRVI